MNPRLILTLLALACLAFPSSSIAAPPAVTQYIIAVPTSHGAKQVSTAVPSGEATLNPRLVRRIPARDQDLRRLVSASGLGAPTLSRATARGEDRPGFGAGLWDSIGGSPMIWLLLGLAAGTVALVVL